MTVATFHVVSTQHKVYMYNTLCAFAIVLKFMMTLAGHYKSDLV